MQQEEEKLLYKCFWGFVFFLHFFALAVSCKMLSGFQIGKIICLDI